MSPKWQQNGAMRWCETVWCSLTDEGSGFGETRLVDLASGEPFPQELLDDFKDSKVTLIAHNAAFERVSFSRYLQQQYPGQYLEPGAFLSPDRWICTMVMAASLTLPMALKDVGEVLRTTQQKDEEGKRLIKLFSAPCKPTKSNGGRTRNLPHHLPEDWAKFKYYCIQDVNTEVDIYKRLKRFPMPAREWHHYRVNERINDRGVRIDTELVQQAIRHSSVFCIRKPQILVRTASCTTTSIGWTLRCTPITKIRIRRQQSKKS